MTFRKSILLLISLSMIAALVACSSSSKSVTTIPPPTTGPLADGNYVFSLQGTDVVDLSPYFVAGSFTVASGAITGGEQDFVDFDNQLSDTISATGSSITASADGNLTIVLATSDTTGVVGVGGVETLNGTILPASTTDRTLVTEFDASASGSGEIDPQSTSGVAAATPTQGYAFVVTGLDQFVENGFPLSIGGVINVDGPGTISGTGSVFDANDGFSGSTFAAETLANTSVVSAPDSFGRVMFTLDATDSADFPEIILAGYIVDATHIRLVETADTYEGTLGGTALSQGANTGTFGTTSVVAGNTYVVSLNGFDVNGVLQAVAQITPSGTTTTASGVIDFNDLVNSSLISATSPDPVTAAAYAVDAAGAGDVTIPNVTDGVNAFNLQLYLDGNGNALAITMDTTDAIGGFGFQQPAAAVGAFTAASFSPAYGLDVTGEDIVNFDEFDAVGPVTADGVSAITGTVDLNWLLNASFTDVPVTGTFTANADGVFTDGLLGLDLTNCATFGGAGCTTADTFNYYLVGDTAGDTFTIETDANQLTLGYFTQQ